MERGAGKKMSPQMAHQVLSQYKQRSICEIVAHSLNKLIKLTKNIQTRRYRGTRTRHTSVKAMNPNRIFSSHHMLAFRASEAQQNSVS